MTLIEQARAESHKFYFGDSKEEFWAGLLGKLADALEAAERDNAKARKK